MTTADREQLAADLKEIAVAHIPMGQNVRDTIWKAAEAIAAASPASVTEEEAALKAAAFALAHAANILDDCGRDDDEKIAWDAHQTVCARLASIRGDRG
jgi:hypothetical protein